MGAAARGALGPKQRRGHRRGRRCAAAAPRHGMNRIASRGRARRRARRRHRAASLSGGNCVRPGGAGGPRCQLARARQRRSRGAAQLSGTAAPRAGEGAPSARGGAGLFGARGGPAEAAAGGGRRVVSGARRRGRRGGASRPAQAFAAAQLASRIERGMAPLAALAEKFLLPAARDTAERTRRTRRAKRPWAQTSAQQQQPAARFSGVWCRPVKAKAPGCFKGKDCKWKHKKWP